MQSSPNKVSLSRQKLILFGFCDKVSTLTLQHAVTDLSAPKVKLMGSWVKHYIMINCIIIINYIIKFAVKDCSTYCFNL